MNLFTFDIETIPDTDAGRKLLDLPATLSDAEVGEAMLNQRRQENGSEFLPHYLHKIVAISVVLKSRDKLMVWSLGEEDSTEKELIERFFDGINKFKPTLITWNGTGFDLPVLHYRGLINKISAPLYWETGAEDNAFKWNNYISRYHSRHTDIMDVLSSYQPRATAPLDKIATLLGFPGKMGMSGNKVWDYYKAGDIKAIRDYCETDVLNTYLVYLRFELFRGKLTAEQYEQSCKDVQDMLKQLNHSHLNEFLEHFNETAR